MGQGAGSKTTGRNAAPPAQKMGAVGRPGKPATVAAKRVRAATKKIAPPKSTGGGGFVFEDEVCAWLLACVLVGEPVFGETYGGPVQLDFQKRVAGWFFDDVLVSTQAGPRSHRFALSVKSNRQLTASKAPPDFVRDAWAQWLHIGSDVFIADADFMGLVTVPLSVAARASVDGLATSTRDADPDDFAAHLVERGWANEDQRALFQSLACQPELAGTRRVDAAETVRLVKRLLFLECDFGIRPSRSESEAIELCRRALKSGLRADAKKLWHALRVRASQLRPHTGHLTRAMLVEELRREFQLAAYPDYEADWQALERLSKEKAETVLNVIAGSIHLERDSAFQGALTAVDQNSDVAILGASGTGKSAVARAVFEARVAAGRRTLWFDADTLDLPDFSGFEQTLGLSHALSELMPAEAGADPLLVLDGLDRQYSERAFRHAARLLLLARRAAPAAQWRVVVASQRPEWPRVQEELERAGFIVRWRELDVRPLSAEELKPVAAAIPSLRQLFLQPRLGGVLQNLKVLDLVARRAAVGGAPDATQWVGESSVAEWFWNAEIDRGADRIARGRLIRELAIEQGDRLLSSVPVDTFQGDMAALSSLSADRICMQVAGARLAFGHDLLGDWARLQILLNNRDGLLAFLESRRESPLWHRALRLFGIYLLEHDNGVSEWRKILALFGTDGPGAVHDLVLEAPIFAVNRRQLLELILPDLVANKGRLLRRLLARFVMFGTVPDPVFLELAKSANVDLSSARATFRMPHWPYWPHVLQFLHAHRAELVPLAPTEIAKVVELWLEFRQAGTVLRPEAAAIAVTLAERLVASRHEWRGRDDEKTRVRIYKCALLSAPEVPDEVVQLGLRAAERVPATLDATPRRRRRGGLFPPSADPPKPWPDGPNDRVDDAFRNAVLDTNAILPLFGVRSDAAREVVLATLIEPPDEDDWQDPLRYPDLELEKGFRWQPPLYSHGPFLAFLHKDFAAGLEVIARLVDFATSRWCVRAERYGSELEEAAEADPNVAARSDWPIRRNRAREVVIPLEPEPKTFVGDSHCFGWGAGVGNAPVAVQVALMALERYLYEKVDAETDIRADVAAVLARGTSTAFLGVLVDVGKRALALFEGPLRPLLVVPELCSWDIEKRTHGRFPLWNIGFGQNPTFLRLVREFHELPHRNIDLRHVAPLLLFRREELRTYFEAWSARVRAEAPPEAEDPFAEMRAQLIVNLDPKNYEERDDPEHGRVRVNAEAERVHAARAEERRTFHENMMVTGMPMRCRKLLDDDVVLSDDDFEAIWKGLERLRELARSVGTAPNDRERFGDEFANAITGAVAVLLAQPRVWAGDAWRRETLIEALTAALEPPPDLGTFDGWDNASDWNWSCFAAEALVMLWVREPANEDWRRGVAAMALRPHYMTVKLLFARCARHRAGLRGDFSRLRRLALEWAYLSHLVELVQHVPPEALQLTEGAVSGARNQLEIWKHEKVEAFANGTLGLLPEKWSDCDERSRFAELESARSRRWARPEMNLRIVRHSHLWLPPLGEAIDDTERAEWLQFWREALLLVLRRPAAFESRGSGHYPNDEERWVVSNVGAMILDLRPDSGPESFWQPVLDLTDEAHDWPEILLGALHRHALSAETTPHTYVPMVKLLVEYAFVEVDGEPRWAYHDSVWDALLALDGHSADLWDARHTGLVEQLAGMLEFWMSRVVRTDRRLANLAHWLTRPAAAPVRFRSLTWLAEVLDGRKNDGDRDRNETADALGRLLTLVWREEEARLRANTSAFDAYQRLLRWLADRQHPRGLDLLAQLGGL